MAFAARQASIRQGTKIKDKTHRVKIGPVPPNRPCHENLIRGGSMLGKGCDFMDLTLLWFFKLVCGVPAWKTRAVILQPTISDEPLRIVDPQHDAAQLFERASRADSSVGFVL